MLNALPEPGRAALLSLRELILQVAEETGTAPLEESLKWGQPAYRPARPRTGTTLRLGWSDETGAALFVPCQTTLLESYRTLFPGAATYVGNRELRLGDGDAKALAPHIAMALTYHRDKG